MPSIIEVDTIKNKTGTQNTVLSTDGSGNNTLNANTIKDGSATKTLAEYASSAWSWGAGVPEGTVLQVKSQTKTTVALMSGTSAENFQDISGLSVDITPKTGSNVLVLTSICAGATMSLQHAFRIVRGSDTIGVGTGASDRPAAGWSFWATATNELNHTHYHFLDESPGGDGSTTKTYKVQVNIETSGSNTFSLNASKSDSDNYYTPRGISIITVMEIAS